MRQRQDGFAIRTIATGERSLTLRVSGEIDLATVPALRTALETAAMRDCSILLDLAAVDFMDSTGIAVLMQALEAARLAGRAFEIRDELAPAVRRVLEITSLVGILPLVDEPGLERGDLLRDGGR